MNKFIKHGACLIAAAVLASPALAAQQTFDMTWSGAEYGNTATATGWITIDTDAIDANYEQVYLPSSWVSALSITVSGASAGDGTYTLADIGLVDIWGAGTLDFSQALLGQQVAGGTVWGAQDGNSGDLEFYATSDSGLTGTGYFTMNTSGYVGDYISLTSLTTAAVAVPEAPAIAMMLAGLGLVGAATRRRQRRG